VAEEFRLKREGSTGNTSVVEEIERRSREKRVTVKVKADGNAYIFLTFMS